MSASFADLGVASESVRALRARGISAPTRIQSLAIPPALGGEDVCGRAPTGSGKTIAFGLPVAARVGHAEPGRPAALILAPTRELAAQIEAEMALLLGRHGRRRVAAFYGGTPYGSQLRSLRRGIDVMVACPGRLIDLVERGAVDLDGVSMVVIDEADRMADMGFLPQVRRILDQVRPDRQTLLFSATLDGDVGTLVRRYQQSPVKVAVEADEQQSRSTSHHWVETRREDRVALAARYIAMNGSTIVFCRTKHGADRVTRQLAAAGVKAVSLHGGHSQSQRKRALAAFSDGRADALVATDVAARGIHVDDVGCVVHFDLPATDKDYIHRSGRTGRAGAKGVVVSLTSSSDRKAVKALQQALGRRVSPRPDSRGRVELASVDPIEPDNAPPALGAAATPPTVPPGPGAATGRRSRPSRPPRRHPSADSGSRHAAKRRDRPERSRRPRRGAA